MGRDIPERNGRKNRGGQARSWIGLQSVHQDGLKSAPRGKGVSSGIAVKLNGTGKSAASARCLWTVNFALPLDTKRNDEVSQPKNTVAAIRPQALPNHIKRKAAGP
jgi:hypothetical protein